MFTEGPNEEGRSLTYLRLRTFGAFSPQWKTVHFSFFNLQAFLISKVNLGLKVTKV